MVDIEPLKTLLDYSDDKKSTIMYFLPLENQNKLKEYNYEMSNFYINERIIAIKKNTLELDVIGKIICIDDDNIITIKLNNIRNVNINTDNYYIFIKPKKRDLEKREFMKQLLEKL